MKALIKPRKVTLNVTHFHPHPDEALASMEAFRFGKDVFIGAKAAPWLFLNAGQLPPTRQRPEDYERGKLVIGTCFVSYDEHGLNKDVRKLYSAASLVARDLQLHRDPAFVPLLEYAVLNDRHGKQTEWDISAIMKAVNLALLSPDYSLTTLNLGMDWWNDAYDYFKMQIERGEKPERPKGELSLNDYITNWLRLEYDPENTIESVGFMSAADVAEELGVADRPELRRILKLATRGHEGVAMQSFDVHCWVEQATALKRSDEYITKRLELIFRSRRVEDTLYWKARAELPSVTTFTHLVRHPANPERLAIYTSTPENRQRIEAQWQEKGYRPVFTIAAVQSNNPTAHRAFKACFRQFLRPDVLIIRQSNRRTAIRWQKYLSGRPFANRLREVEGQLAKPPYSLTPEQRLQDGNHHAPDGCQRPWYYFEEGGWMLNGSFTAPDINELPSTRQSVHLVIKQCIDALRYLDKVIRKQKAQRSSQGRRRSQDSHKDRIQRRRSKPKFSNTPHVRT